MPPYVESDFFLYFKLGLRHVLDPHGLDHALFIIALAVPYAFRQWKTVLLLLSLFTIGHTCSLILVVYKILSFDSEVIELLLQCTILLAAINNFLQSGKDVTRLNINRLAIVTLVFGVIHGFGLSDFFMLILGDKKDDRLLPVAEFALGVETAHITVAFCVLLLWGLVSYAFRLSKRDWTLVLSSFVAGVVLPMILYNKIWQ